MRRRFDRATAMARMILAAIFGASLSILSSESLPRFSRQQDEAARQLAERRSPSSTAISPKARPLRSVAISTAPVTVELLDRNSARMDDAHEGPGIAFAEDGLTRFDGADAEVTRCGVEVRREQGVEQTAVHQHVANFIVQ